MFSMSKQQEKILLPKEKNMLMSGDTISKLLGKILSVTIIKDIIMVHFLHRKHRNGLKKVWKFQIAFGDNSNGFTL